MSNVCKDVIKKYVYELTNEYPFMMKEYLSDDFIEKVKYSFAYGIENQNVIAICDTSTWGNGKEGCVLAEGYMIFYEKGGENSFVSYKNIKSVDVIDNVLWIMTEKEEIYRLTDSNYKKDIFRNMLLELIQKEKEVKPKEEPKPTKVQKERNLSHQEKLMIVKNELCNIAGSNKFHYGDSIPYDVLEKIRKKYKVEVSLENALGAIDTSVFGNWKSGCLFTDEGFYWTEFLDGVRGMRYDDLKNVVLMGNNADDGENYIVMTTHYDLVAHRVEDGILKKTPLARTLKKLQTKYFVDVEE